MSTLNRRIALAPMMDWTDRHYRYLLRLISKHMVLYTEMISSQALEFGDSDRLLAYDQKEHPLALQIGSRDVRQSVLAGQKAQSYGYDEINLNVGCPSDRVQQGGIGLCLMKEPLVVAEILQALKKETDLQVTLKTRIGVDEQDSYEDLKRFIEIAAKAEPDAIIIHARKGWLKGLSPKENRTVPPINYARVYQIKEDFPHLHIGINGDINDIDAIEAHLEKVDSVMLGRFAYYHYMQLNTLDQRFFKDTSAPICADTVLEQYKSYMQSQMEQGTRLWAMARHLMPLFQSCNGAKLWRSRIALCNKMDATLDHIDFAREAIEQ